MSQTNQTASIPSATAPTAAVSSSPTAGNQDHTGLTNDGDGFIAADDAADDAVSLTAGSIASSTTRISESIRDYRLENGRTYHRYKDGKYNLPNDERENERLDLQHNLVVRSFDGRLGNAPPNDPGADVGRVLDLGTGSGIWAIEFGDEHPEAEVIGVDLSATQPEFVPPNVQFEIDDVEETWTYSRPFDYIHSRMMTSSISNWKAYIKQAYDNLSSGGYLELNEPDAAPLSDDGTLRDDSALMKSIRLLEEAARAFGRTFEDIQGLKGMMIETGFEDVQIKRFKWPTNGWAKDPKYREIGAWNHENFAPNWEGFTMAPFTRALGWTKEEVLVHAIEVRRDLADRRIHAYFSLWSIWGRKPE
ncbi:S-adenosyl-L-methionine-dependent methyltransferase [Colletotrichum caudatum]|nr:S-adenosyl-L-methionine-dependent methyltransferase [Colletotrichum caudatum]